MQGLKLNARVWKPHKFKYDSFDRITMTSENGRGTLTIRDVKEGDQGAYTCEAINAKGLVFAIPDGVLSLSQRPNPGTASVPYNVNILDYCMFCIICLFLSNTFFSKETIWMSSFICETQVILLFFDRMLWHCCLMTVRQLRPDGGGLTILCLPCRSCPVVSSSLYALAGNCRDGHFSVGDHCMPCFCFGITKHCQSTGRYRSQITLRFTEEDDFKGTQLIKNSDFCIYVYGFTVGGCSCCHLMCNTW